MARPRSIAGFELDRVDFCHDPNCRDSATPAANDPRVAARAMPISHATDGVPPASRLDGVDRCEERLRIPPSAFVVRTSTGHERKAMEGTAAQPPISGRESGGLKSLRLGLLSFKIPHTHT